MSIAANTPRLSLQAKLDAYDKMQPSGSSLLLIHLSQRRGFQGSSRIRAHFQTVLHATVEQYEDTFE
jgi:hypothetical protein